MLKFNHLFWLYQLFIRNAKICAGIILLPSQIILTQTSQDLPIDIPNANFSSVSDKNYSNFNLKINKIVIAMTHISIITGKMPYEPIHCFI